jgi:phenylacetate-CoA ligase
LSLQYWQPDIECAPVEKLAALLEARLAETDVFMRAARSPLYAERWRKAGIDPAAIKSYADLQRVPFTNSGNLRDAQTAHHPDELICSDQRPRYWVSTSGSTGVSKWIPIGGPDLEAARQVGFRHSLFIREQPITEDDVTFGVSAPAPFMSDTLIWPGAINNLRGDGPLGLLGEVVAFSFERGVEGVGMALKRKVSVFIAFPSLVMKIAEGLSESAPRLAARQLREKFSLLNLVLYLITRVHKVRAHDLVRVHTGLFAGEPLDPYREALYSAWGLKHSYNIYTFSELQIGIQECSAHDGLHVWMDVMLPEIIMQSDLEREREDPSYVPPSQPLWTAKAGDEGELVLTTFTPTFPLVRWRTSDLVRVHGTDPCQCGRTHPRVHFLQRSDDLVNLGVIRFSVFTLKEKLDAISRPAAVARWQLVVSRAGYKPLLAVLVAPQGPVDEEQMKQAVRAAVDQIDVLRTGWQNGLVSEPAVRIVPDLGERLSTSGKFRPLVYETAPSKAGQGGRR